MLDAIVVTHIRYLGPSRGSAPSSLLGDNHARLRQHRASLQPIVNQRERHHERIGFWFFFFRIDEVGELCLNLYHRVQLNFCRVPKQVGMLNRPGHEFIVPFFQFLPYLPGSHEPPGRGELRQLFPGARKQIGRSPFAQGNQGTAVDVTDRALILTGQRSSSSQQFSDLIQVFDPNAQVVRYICVVQ